MNFEHIVIRCTSLERFFCKTKGIEFPCVFCEDDCIEFEKEIMRFPNGTAIRTPNSALIHMNLAFQDDVDNFLYSKLNVEIGRMTKIVMKEAEKGYDVSFFISNDDVKNESEKKKIQGFLLGYREKIGALIVSGKSQINTWMRKAAGILFQILQ
ncbi:MAG: hypothetical protein ACE5I5_00680 [Candidatus Heimdallarchaeota archaeon]